MGTTKKASSAKPAAKRDGGQESDHNDALKKLFINELKDVHGAEKQLLKALKKMIKAANSGELRKAFETHLTQSENQVERIKQVFESIDEKAASKTCEAMAGLVAEAEELISDTEDGTVIRDAALIAAAQKVEHYEIASYGTLKTFAGILNYTEAEGLLDETLQEEKQTDELLTNVSLHLLG